MKHFCTVCFIFSIKLGEIIIALYVAAIINTTRIASVLVHWEDFVFRMVCHNFAGFCFFFVLFSYSG